MSKRFKVHFVYALMIVGLVAACDSVPGNNDDEQVCCDVDDPEDLRLLQVESDLLSRINAERLAYDPPRPALHRDPGMDQIMLWHVSQMAEYHFLDHTDRNDRRAALRAQYYGDNPAARCSEIIQWWSGTPNGQVHYDSYFNSPPHHSAYLEEGIFNLGPTSWTGLAAISGTGPAGTSFEGKSGSYTGVMFCETPITLAIDPFSE